MHAAPHPKSLQATLAAVACLALALGLLVYAWGRPVAHTMLLPGLGAAHGGLHLGSVGGWLPSFLHPLAFSLLAAALQPPHRPPRYRLCAAWGLVNVVCELGQWPAAASVIAGALAAAPLPQGLTGPVAAYFVRGTFDPADLVAAVAGAAAAAALWHVLHHHQEHAHAT